MSELLFIFNPYSGKGEIKNKLFDIVNIFVRAGYKVCIYPTQGQKDAYNYVLENGEKYDRLVCSGGDGTLSEVISGVMQLEKKPVIGYIPSGSTNDVANGLKLPKSITRAAKIAVKGNEMQLDIGTFNNTNFVYVAAFGAFTEVSYSTPQDMKNLLGHVAYLIEGIKRIPNLKTYHMTIKNDEEIIEDDFLYGMVANAVSVGGIKGITGKDVDLSDGKFEVILVKRAKNPLELQNILNCLMGLDFNGDNFIKFQTSKLYIKTEEEVAWVLDGEYGGKPNKIIIKNNKRAVTVMANTGIPIF